MWKCKSIKQRFCVGREEKTEQLMDSKHEVERLDQELQKVKQEVSSFL